MSKSGTKRKANSDQKQKTDGSNKKVKHGGDKKKELHECSDEEENEGDEDLLDDVEEFTLPDDLPKMEWLDFITLDSTVSIFGKRNTGKSFYARYLLYILKDYIPWGWCLTNTPQNGWWQQMIPEKRIYKGWRPDLIKKIMEIQRERIRNKEINPFVFIILDDIVSDNALRYDPTLRELYYEGRHFGIFILICAQYVYGLPPGNRANTDFAITFTQHQQRQIKQLHEDYMTEYKNWQYLRRDMNRILGEHECLIINQRDPDLRGVERYHKDKANEPPPFYMGTKQYWEGSDWEEQVKKWKPIADRDNLEKMKKMKEEMEWKHTVDDSSFEKSEGGGNETPLLERIMGYGGFIPSYF
jgi:hypothetical protein